MDLMVQVVIRTAVVPLRAATEGTQDDIQQILVPHGCGSRMPLFGK